MLNYSVAELRIIFFSCNNNKKGVQPFVACAFRLPPSDLHNTSIEQSTPMSVNFHTACSHCANIGGIQRREQELKAQYLKSIERKR